MKEMNNEELMAVIEKQLQEARVIAFTQSGQISLGQLIKQIEDCEKNYSDDSPKNVVYDFGWFIPTGIHSWRGAYSELAIGYSENKEAVKVTDFLASLKITIGQTFEGYKGGDYVMTQDTPVWVANAGSSGHTAICGVKDSGCEIVLLTCFNEY